MTPQEKMRKLLQASGIPAKDIKVFGSSILITCYSRNAADKWATFISAFARIRGISETRDYAKENLGTCLAPTTVKVWRLGAAIR